MPQGRWMIGFGFGFLRVLEELSWVARAGATLLKPWEPTIIQRAHSVWTEWSEHAFTIFFYFLHLALGILKRSQTEWKGYTNVRGRKAISHSTSSSYGCFCYHGPYWEDTGGVLPVHESLHPYYVLGIVLGSVTGARSESLVTSCGLDGWWWVGEIPVLGWMESRRKGMHVC